MREQAIRVLFLSRRNTARSLMAEAILNQSGRGRFVGLSAGVERVGQIDPLTVAALEAARYSADGLQPKLIAEAVPEGADDLDFVFTLSDTARGEAMPTWPGHPISAHWACEDPVLMTDDEFGPLLDYGRVLAGLERRIKIFVELPLESLDRASLQHRVESISDS